MKIIMMKKFSERILGVFLLGLAFVISYPIAVYAANACDKTASTLDSKYGAKILYDGDDDLITIKLNKSKYNTDLLNIIDEISFKISEIDLYDASETEGEDDLGKPLEKLSAEANAFTISTVFGIDVNTVRITPNQGVSLRTYKNGSDLIGYVVYLVPDGFTDPDIKKTCPEDKDWGIKLRIEVAPKIADKEVSSPIEVPEPNIPAAIDCGCTKDNNWAINKNLKDGFETNYCELKCKVDKLESTPGGGGVIRAKITNKNLDKNTYEKYFGEGSRTTFKCDPFTFTTSGKATSDEAYYQNVKYLHASMTTDVSGTYVYHYGCNTKEETASCSMSCNEYVSVEYGAPVASKAGLCFEYKVKVTSRVNCAPDGEIPKPKTKGKLCTPVPYCNHGGGWISHAAGPNEDFDACIDACDGGKYTTACSATCYDEVYGSTNDVILGIQSKAFITDFAEIAETIANHNNDTIDRDTSCDYSENARYTGYVHEAGKYVCNQDTGYIKWYSSGCKAGHSGLARFYYELWSETGRRYKHKCIKTTKQGGGISAVCGCYASCSWSGCRKGNVYLNQKELDKDLEANLKVYNTLIDSCASKAKCSTTQSEFTISVDYSHKGKTTTIDFPYVDEGKKSNPATIQYGAPSITCSPASTSSTNIFLKTNGCYSCGQSTTDFDESKKNAANWYMAEWTFPGTWANLKNQDQISYRPKEGYYLLKKNKFCLPKQTDDVNQKWWNYYFITEKKNNGFEYSCNPKEVTFTTNDVKNLNYNIRATTTHFGLFQWNIGIDCFYAVNSGLNSKNSDTDPTTCSPLKTDAEPASARAVDLQNLFPDSEGGTGSNRTSREPGFNWTNYAASDKDPNYVSNPEAYRSFVQSINYSVYDENYLDYYFTLSKDDILELRKRNASSKDFNKSSLREENITNNVHYVSDLFRDRDGALFNSSKGDLIPDFEALKCNNMINYNSSLCFVVEDKVYE